MTGAAQGIGRGSALAFARAGATVAICDLNAEKGEAVAQECRDLGVQAKFYKLDVTNTENVRAVRDEILKDFGKISCLHSNAGISQDVFGPPLTDVPDETWEKTYAVNVFGAVKVCREFSVPMKEARYGKIVITASVAAYSQSFVMSAYSSSKLAALSVMVTLAKELGSYNINVNAVNPGFVYTPMYANEEGSKQLKSKAPALQKFGDPHEVMAALAANSALKREQTPEDLANGVLFLCSDSSKEITGQVLQVDSGHICRI